MDKKILKYNRRDAEFNNLSFLARPLRGHKDDLRFHINHFLVDKYRQGVSTNGSVLFVVKRVPLIRGFYKANKVHRNYLEIEYVGTEEEHPNYPDYKDIVSDWGKETGPHVDILVESDHRPSYSQALAKIIRAMNDHCMDIRWLEMLTDGNWDGYIRDEHPNYFHQGERQAFIMALRI